MKSYFPRFVCPKCACEQLVEVRHHVTRTVAAIKHTDNDDWPDVIYDKSFVHGLEPEDIQYLCGDCDYVLKEITTGEIVHSEAHLGFWLTAQAEARMANIKFTCPSCGGHQLDDNVEIDDEGFCDRLFCCHDCGEVVCDQDESALRKILEWGQKCSEKRET
jgi:predicted RNA-binding Zn-ribbon protein involved in translation (DUF1610 family)